MSLSCSFVVGPISSPPHKIAPTSPPHVSSPPLYSPTFPRISFFLYPPTTSPSPLPHPHGHRNSITSTSSASASAFAFLHHPPAAKRLSSASMTRGPHGFLRASSCCNFRGDTGAQFETGSGADDEQDKSAADEEEEEEDDDDDIIVEEEEAGRDFGSSLLPERWDVLGLGQAMVIFIVFPVFCLTACLLQYYQFIFVFCSFYATLRISFYFSCIAPLCLIIDI